MSPLSGLPGCLLEQFGFFGWGEIELCGAGELGFRFVGLAGIDEDLTPFQVQAAPFGRVFLRLREFRQSEV